MSYSFVIKYWVFLINNNIWFWHNHKATFWRLLLTFSVNEINIQVNDFWLTNIMFRHITCKEAVIKLADTFSYLFIQGEPHQWVLGLVFFLRFKAETKHVKEKSSKVVEIKVRKGGIGKGITGKGGNNFPT